MNSIDDIFATRKSKTNLNTDNRTQNAKSQPEKFKVTLETPESKNPKKKKSKKAKSIATGIHENINDENSNNIPKVEIVEFKKPELKREHLPEDELFKPKRRVMDDGLPIYKEDELNIGLGKDTPECPFDCDCCF